MTSRAFRPFILVGLYTLCHLASATGMLPDTPLLVISEADGSAQMGLLNTEAAPLLLHTTIRDIPEDPAAPRVYAVPPVVRVEAKSRQLVRFLLEKTAEPIKVQHLKRVQFEGIPATSGDKDQNGVRITVSQDLPVVISPKGLEQDPEPWRKIQWRLSNRELSIANPSPFVARLSPEVVLLPSEVRARLLPRPYVLPGDAFTIALPEGVDAASVTGLRLQPASPYGFSVGTYDVSLPR